MTRHPSENFIKFLMTSANVNAADDQWIMFTVVQLGYPKIELDYLTWLRTEVNSRKPAVFSPQNRYDRHSVKFMRAEGVFSLHNPDKSTREANLLVTNLRCRILVENLLLGRVEPKEVAKKVNARMGEFFTSAGIEAYAHYYWNVGLLRVEDWAKLLEDYEVTRQQTLAILQVGPSLALHKMGFQQSIDTKTILKETMEALYFDMREWKVQPRSSFRTQALTSLAKGMVQVDTQLSQADSALKDSLKAFEQFRMQHAEKAVPDLRVIAPDGNFTGSGIRLLEAAPVSEEGKHDE